MEKEKEPREYAFTAWGHPNIRATHPTTLMFTKDPECTAKGDCIVGVRADFDSSVLKGYLCDAGKVKIIISALGGGKATVEIYAVANQNFGDTREVVIRRTDYLSDRTLAIRATKAANGLGIDFVKLLKDPSTEIGVTLIK